MSISQVNMVFQAGSSVSGILDNISGIVVGILVPSTWLSTPSAPPITFFSSLDLDATFQQILNELGNELVLPVTANKYFRLLPGYLGQVASLKLQSGTHEIPVVQPNMQTLILRIKQ